MLKKTWIFASFLSLCTASFSGDASAQEAVALETPSNACVVDPTDIYVKAASSVLKVLTLDIDPMRLVARVQAGTGSAIALGDGYFVTNYHVVGLSTEVMLIAGEAFLSAIVVGIDPALDVALLYSPEEQFLKLTEALRFAPESRLLPGQRVYTVGYPLGAELAISGGMISAIERLLPLNTLSWTVRYIQTDAAVSPGNSGGALLDECGHLLGMVTLKSITPGAENISYALPNETLTKVISEIRDNGRVVRAWHGIYGQMVTPLILSLLGADPSEGISGFLVETVEPGSGAERAGIMGGTLPVLWGMGEFILGGDIITHVNGRAIQSMGDAIDVVESLNVGDAVSLSYLRNGELISATVVLEERPIFESDAYAYMPN